MKNWTFVFLFTTSTAFAGTSLSEMNCYQRRNGFIVGHWLNGIIGQAKYAFKTLQECQLSVQVSLVSTEPLVCTPSKNGYELTHWQRFKPLAEQDVLADFVDLKSCLKSVRMAQKNLSCAWTGYTWSLFSVQRGKVVGRTEISRGQVLVYGFSTQDSCHKALLGATPQQVCNWNGDSYQSYEIRTSQLNSRWQTESLDECIKVLNNSEINNQEGKIL